MKNNKVNRNYFKTQILEKGLTIQEIGKQLEVEEHEVVRAIKGAYMLSKWADRLIEFAEENANKKRLVVVAGVNKTAAISNTPSTIKSVTPALPVRLYADQRAVQEGIAIVDSNYFLEYFDTCKRVKKLYLPAFCLGEMKKVSLFTSDEGERAAIEEKIAWCQENCEIIRAAVLPYVSAPEGVEPNEIKPRSFMFAKYVLYVREMVNKNVVYLTRSREVKSLIPN